jgi:hypothetical protein
VLSRSNATHPAMCWCHEQEAPRPAPVRPAIRMLLDAAHALVDHERTNGAKGMLV